MNKFIKSMLNLAELEQFAKRKLWVNEMSSVIKILLTFTYIILLTAIGKYNLVLVLYFGVYPLLMMNVIDIPLKSFLSKLLIPSIFAISLGLANPLLDQQVVGTIAGVHISGGVLSLITLYFKAIWSISATLLLVSTTTIEKLGQGLQKLRVPARLIVLLLLMYRYIGVLLNEVSRTIDAYQLRSSGGRSIHVSAWGSLVGQIMIRSYRRSEEIYNAMLLRGYHLGDTNVR